MMSRLIIFIIFLCNSFQLLAKELPEFDCLIEPEVVTIISSPIQGVIETIYVGKGDIIKKGQPLAQLESSVERATVALAFAKANMDKEIELKRAILKFSKLKYERMKKLHKQSAVSDAEKDEAKAKFEIATIELSEALEKRILSKLELARAEKSLLRRTFTSPLSGVVVDKYISPGESVSDKKIIKVVQIHPLRVNVIIPSEYFGTIHKDMSAIVTIEEPYTKKVKAIVRRVDRVIDPSSGQFDVHLSLPNPDYKLPSGLRCVVNFIKRDEKEIKLKQTVRNPDKPNMMKELMPLSKSINTFIPTK